MEVLKHALTQRGLLAATARELGVKSPTLIEWRDGDRPVPARHCPRLAAFLSIDRRTLRPTDWGDIWPELIDAEHPWPPMAELTQESA